MKWTKFLDYAKWRWLESLLKWSTSHHHNDEIQPTPGIREVTSESICDPFENHFHGKNDCKKLINVFQRMLQPWSLFEINIFHCLERKWSELSDSQIQWVIQYDCWSWSFELGDQSENKANDSLHLIVLG